MNCNRLKVLIRDWYHEVRTFTLSPIKMMELIEKHVQNCEICQKDENLPIELDQLREIIRVPHKPPVEAETKIISEETEYLYEEDLEELEEEEEF